MKKLICAYLCLSALILGEGSLYADDDFDVSTQDLGSEHISSAGEAAQTPFRFSLHGDWIQRSKIKKQKYHHQHAGFYTATAQLESVIYYDPDCDEALVLGLGYTDMRFEWHQNPYFKTTEMGQVSFTLSGYSERLYKWRWQTQLTANWEPRYHGFWLYTNYDILLWGRHEYSKDFHFHIGFLAQTGMKIDRIYPVLGIDWTFSEKWMLNLIFPVNMSLVYTITDSLSGALAIRLFDVRYRYGKHEHVKRALLEYRNGGLELAVNYGKKALAVNLHVGVTAGGLFRISRHDNTHKKHFTMDPAVYAGGEVSRRF